jgi:hypothetical protein
MWAISGATVYFLYEFNLAALIYKCGVLFDCLGLYWIFRQSISSWQYVELLVKWFATCAIISAGFVIIERITQFNPFSCFGAVETGIHRGRYL